MMSEWIYGWTCVHVWTSMRVIDQSDCILVHVSVYVCMYVRFFVLLQVLFRSLQAFNPVQRW